MGVYSPGFAFLKGYIELAKNWASRKKTSILCEENGTFDVKKLYLQKGKIQAFQEILELLEKYDNF